MLQIIKKRLLSYMTFGLDSDILNFLVQNREQGCHQGLMSRLRLVKFLIGLIMYLFECLLCFCHCKNCAFAANRESAKEGKNL